MPLPTTPALSVDCVVINSKGELLFVKRGHEPHLGQLALPGGFVEIGESVEDACRRELREETAVEVEELLLVGVYSKPNRDPRGHTVSVAFLALIDEAEAVAGDDAADAVWLADLDEIELAFDHREIVDDALDLVFAAGDATTH